LETTFYIGFIQFSFVCLRAEGREKEQFSGSGRGQAIAL
jgi:hypothetical protein